MSISEDKLDRLNLIIIFNLILEFYAKSLSILIIFVPTIIQKEKSDQESSKHNKALHLIAQDI